MEKEAERESLIISYLLGDLPKKDEDEFEDQYFTNESMFEDLLIVEDELIDTYVLDELSSEEREKFEKRFLISAARRERVENARILLMTNPAYETRRISSSERHSPSGLQSLLAFLKPQNQALRLLTGISVVILTLGVSWLLISYLRQSTLPRPQQTISFEMLSTSIRSGTEPRVLEIPRETAPVEFKLYFERGNYEKYTAALHRASGDEIQRYEGLEAQAMSSGKMVVVTVPADMLSTGFYFITLTGNIADSSSNIVGEYYFKTATK